MDNPHRPPFLRALWEMILAYRPRPSVGGLRRLRILLPSPGNVLFTLLVVGGLFWAGSVGAVPLLQTAASSTNTVAYQGRLADATGNPVTATTPMVFRLYNAATGGTPLWEENWTGSNSVHVSDGLFNVMLGSLTQIPQSVVTGNSNLWLGITVNADNEMQPRVQLGTVPFAVQALTVPDGSITAAKLAPDVSFVPPDGSISTAKIADGAVTAAKQTVSTFSAADPNPVRLQGAKGPTVISEFSFTNVPAGDTVVMLSLYGYAEPNTASAGSIYLEVNGTYIQAAPTHVIVPGGTFTSMMLHGRYPNFSGGTLIVRVVAVTETASANVVFGVAGSDPRFGRFVTVMAGM